MREIAVTPSLHGLTGSIPARDWQAIVAAAAAHWNDALESCCNVRLTVVAAQNRWVAAEDSVNLIVLRQGLWCHNEQCGHTSTFPPNALAMTTVYPEGAKGADLREADVEISAKMLHAVPPDKLPKDLASQALITASGVWIIAPPNSDYPVLLESVLVHEVGHVLGLSDSCASGHESGGPPRGCSADQIDRVMAPDAHQLRPTAADVAELQRFYPLSFDWSHMWLWLSILIAGLLVLAAAIWRWSHEQATKS